MHNISDYLILGFIESIGYTVIVCASCLILAMTNKRRGR